MKWKVDGDQIMVTKDDFENLQESPAVFVPTASGAGQRIQQHGVLGLSINDLVAINDLLNSGGGDFSPFEPPARRGRKERKR
jgi:hypothetical protein